MQINFWPNKKITFTSSSSSSLFIENMCQVQSLFHHVRNDGGVGHHHNHRHRTTIFLLFYLQIFISITLLITLNDKIFVHCQQQQQRAKSIESTTNESRSDPITSSSSSTIKWMPISINNDPTQQQSERKSKIK